MKLHCATGNPGKLREFQMAAMQAGIDLGALAPLEIELLPRFGEIPPCVEDGATFEENAVKKALHYGRFAPGLLFADDSGLEVDALGGAPMLDLCYEEDSQADVDMNVVMTGSGQFVEIQATAEHTPFDDKQMGRLLDLARGGIAELVAIQKQTAPLR